VQFFVCNNIWTCIEHTLLLLICLFAVVRRVHCIRSLFLECMLERQNGHLCHVISNIVIAHVCDTIDYFYSLNFICRLLKKPAAFFLQWWQYVTVVFFSRSIQSYVISHMLFSSCTNEKYDCDRFDYFLSNVGITYILTWSGIKKRTRQTFSYVSSHVYVCCRRFDRIEYDNTIEVEYNIQMKSVNER
jgi:hypothetical protein